MEKCYEFQPVAHIENDFTSLFGIPRQGGLCRDLLSTIVWEEGFGREESLRGIEGFSHLWLLWVFSEHVGEGWSPTVRPPKLGGNTRVGVFASRSPYRPNPIGMSVVRLEGIGPGNQLLVSGADLMNGTPILDIKPYLPYSDCVEDARGGFAPLPEDVRLAVEDPTDCLSALGAEKQRAALQFLSADPRPGYQAEPERVYGVNFSGRDIRFTVRDGVLRVLECRDLLTERKASTPNQQEGR